MRLQAAVVAFVISLAWAGASSAEDVAGHIESARGAYGRGDQLHALANLQAALRLLNDRLTDQFGKFLPPAPAGWDLGTAESQSLDNVGGGLIVSRSYSKGEAALNVTLTIDNPAVGTSASMLRSGADVGNGWSRLKLGTDDALLRFDPTSRSGEITMVLGERVLLQVEGTEIAGDGVLVEIAKGWNMAGIRKLVGLGS
jgi:hypothetical protein